MHPLTPDQIHLLTLAHTIARDHPISVTSWIRSPARNALVGGSPTSAHLTGDALDVVADDPQGYAALTLAARRHAYIVRQYATHIHIALPRARRSR